MRLRRNALRRIVGVMSGVLLVGGVHFAALAQDEKPQPGPVKMMSHNADPDWDVAVVRASNPNDTRGQHIDMRGQHVALLDTTLEQFLLLGYGVQKSQLVNLPEWAKTVQWDVDGVPNVEGTPSLSQIQSLIRKILVERFKLQLHHEQREQPIFALTIEKGGPKMVPDTSDPNGLMNQNNSENGGRHVEALRNASMGDLTLILQFHVDRPIVDQTGLTGRYDFKLQWTLDDAPNGVPDAPPGLFTAIQEQIGLKLTRVKAPADTLVVDKVAKPGAN